MKTNLSGNQDVLAGLVFILFGAIGLLIALGYHFGSSIEMGPGYFPRVLSVLLIAFGGAVFVRGLRSGLAIEGLWAWMPLLWLTLSLVLFGATIERFGLMPAVAALIVTSAYAGHEFKLKEVAVLTGIMAVFAAAVFVWGLKLPYPLFAWNI